MCLVGKRSDGWVYWFLLVVWPGVIHAVLAFPIALALVIVIDKWLGVNRFDLQTLFIDSLILSLAGGLLFTYFIEHRRT